MRNQEISLISPLPDFAPQTQHQPMSFTSFGHQGVAPRPVTFSTFQKPPPSVASPPSHSFVGHNLPPAASPSSNRFANPRARPLPTLMEQVHETDSISAKSEVPVVYADEGTPPNLCSETTSLSGLTVDGGKDVDDHLSEVLPQKDYTTFGEDKYQLPKPIPVTLQQSVPMPQLTESDISAAKELNMQIAESPPTNHFIEETANEVKVMEETNIHNEEQVLPCPAEKVFSPSSSNEEILTYNREEPDLPKLKEKDENSELEETLSKTNELSTPDRQINSEDRNVKKAASPAMDLLKQEERDSSMSEVSEGEEDILAQCISSAMPTPTSSARKMRRSSSDNALKKSGIPLKSNGDSSSPSSKTAKSSSSSRQSNLPRASAAVSSIPSPSSSQSLAPKQSSSAKDHQSFQPLSTSKPPRSSKSSHNQNRHESPSSGSYKGKSSPKSNQQQPSPSLSSKSSDHSNKSMQQTVCQSNKPSLEASSDSTTTINRITSPVFSSENNRPIKVASIPPLSQSKTTPSASKPPKPTPPPRNPAYSKDTHENEDESRLPAIEKTGYDDVNQDIMTSFATEGTPLNFSNSTSLSDLSVMTGMSALSKTLPAPDSPSKQQQHSSQDDAKSDNSSICEESEEQLLSEMIQSAMPKNKSNRKSAAPNEDDNSVNNGIGNRPPSRDCNMSAFVPRMSNYSVVPPFHDFLPVDTIKSYNVEGTPKNFSAATSLSDLTIDSIEGQSSGMTGKGLSRKTSSQNANQSSNNANNNVNNGILKQPITGNNHGYQPMRSSHGQPIRRVNPTINNFNGQDQVSYGVSFTPPSNDTMHTYQVEGTPKSFSRQDSVNSLIDTTGHPHNDKDESDSSSSIPKERHVVGQSSEDSSIAGDKGDRLIKFSIEDTPVTFSRNSSLSSLTSIDHKIDPLESIVADTNKVVSSQARKEGKNAKAIDESVLKPAVSTDSLSDEDGNDCDPTPTEQLLLEQCIYAALPKSRLPRGEESARRHSRAKHFIQCKSPMTNKAGNRSSSSKKPSTLTKSASLEIPTDTNDLHSSNHLMQSASQMSLNNEKVSNADLMTRSCSDTTELDFDSLPHSRQSRYSAWKRKRHHSQEEIASNDCPDVPSHDGARVRSHSQEYGSDFKMQKDISNKLAQVNGRDIPSSQRFSSVEANRQKSEKDMSDFAAKVREISSCSMAGLVALKGDDELNQAVYGHNDKTSNRGHDRFDNAEHLSQQRSKFGVPVIELNGEFQNGAVGNEIEDGDESQISPEEEERLLMENIHLVVNELEATKMSGSAIDEDMFIENETISLVSNEYNSDSNSEISLTWSDKHTDFSTKGPENVTPAVRGSSKIVKPGESQQSKTIDVAEANDKAVRGRRKPLYPGKSAVTTHMANKNNASLRLNPVPVVGKTPTTNVANNKMASTGLTKKNISPRSGLKVAQVSPRTRQDDSPSAKKGRGQGVKQTPPNPSMTSTKVLPTSAGRGRGGMSSRSPSVGSRNNCGPPSSTGPRTSNNNTKSSPSSNSKSANTSPSSTNVNKCKQQNTSQKPKMVRPNSKTPPNPAAKGSTNNNVRSNSQTRLKSDSPSENKENKEQITLRDKKPPSTSAASNRLSSGSIGSVSDTNPANESWSKALDSYNFVVDTNQDGMAYKHIQMQRNAQDAPESIKRTLKATNKPDSTQLDSHIPEPQPSKGIPKKTMSKQSNIHLSSDSLKSQNRSVTPISGSSRRSSNSSGSGIPTRKSDSSSSPLSSDSGSKKIPLGPIAKRQVPSKIATLWKREGSTERSPSRDSLSSPHSSSRLPTLKNSPSNNKPSSLPPSGFKTKAATLPAGSSLSSSKSKSVGEGICKSSTYEKISTMIAPKAKVSKYAGKKAGLSAKEVQNTGKSSSSTRKTLATKTKSPGCEINKGIVFELCDDEDDVDADSIERYSYCANDSMDNNVFNDSYDVPETRHTLNSTAESFDSLDENDMNQIDSSTFKRKKRDPSMSDFVLPNADETCRSMCSFNDSIGANSSANALEFTLMKIAGIDESIASEVSIISKDEHNASAISKASKKSKVADEKHGGKTKSKVAQGLKRLFSSGKHKDKEKDFDSGKSKNSKSHKGKKSKDKDSDINIEYLHNAPLNTSFTIEEKSFSSQGTSTQHAAAPQNKNQSNSILRPEHKISPSAIVAPFNYSPPVNTNSSTSAVPINSNVLVIDLDSSSSFPLSTNSNSAVTGREDLPDTSPQSSIPSATDGFDLSAADDQVLSSEKPLTKTEMLLARRNRKKSLLSNRSIESGDKESDTSSNLNGQTEGGGSLPAPCMVTTV